MSRKIFYKKVSKIKEFQHFLTFCGYVVEKFWKHTIYIVTGWKTEEKFVLENGDVRGDRIK